MGNHIKFMKGNNKRSACVLLPDPIQPEEKNVCSCLINKNAPEISGALPIYSKFRLKLFQFAEKEVTFNQGIGITVAAVNGILTNRCRK